MFETVFICEKSGELKPDLTTIAHFAIQLSYYAMSYLQHFLQACAGGFFVLIEGVGVNVQRGGGLTVAENARHRGHIRAAKAEAEQDAGHDTTPQRTWWKDKNLTEHFLCEIISLIHVYEIFSDISKNEPG